MAVVLDRITNDENTVLGLLKTNSIIYYHGDGSIYKKRYIFDMVIYVIVINRFTMVFRLFVL